MLCSRFVGGAVMERALDFLAVTAVVVWFFVMPVVGALYLIGALK